MYARFKILVMCTQLKIIPLSITFENKYGIWLPVKLIKTLNKNSRLIMRGLSRQNILFPHQSNSKINSKSNIQYKHK